jgi:hypothetical protein
VCRNNLCEADTGQSLTPPADPKCYTPCKGGYHQADGTYIACDSDGLLAGCIDGATCKKGTCVPAAMTMMPVAADGGAAEAGAPRSSPVDLGKCDTDDDCPLFQTCLDHACYADCASDGDCHGGRRCYMKSCRVPCSTASSQAATTATACPTGESCTSKDGVSGFCLPTGAPPAPPATPDPRADNAVETDFTLSTSAVRFTPGRSAEDVTLTNGTAISRTLTITKVSETEVKNDVPAMTTDNPLPWLQMSVGSDAPAAVQQLTLTLPAGGSTTLHLAGAVNKAVPRWQGQLQIASPGRPSRLLALELDANPEGQWTGRATYFAQFGTRSLDAWVADKGNQAKLNLVGNALVRRWGAFRNGRISWDEFKAALQATTTESWRTASVEQRCPSPDAPNPNAACYLYDNAAGISVYSDFLPDSPVPTGETDFPVVFDLHAGASATDWTGRVVSTEALQYPGDPAVTLSFESDPGVCAGAICTTGLKSFDFDTWAGGRYVTTPDDANCFGSISYAHATIPWLVPGFIGNTTADATGARYRHECRDTRLPYGDAPGESAFNGSLAGGNPIPDGTSRHRHISLLDGVMVNQDALVLLFKESFPSFLGPTDATGFQSYGTMVLTRSSAEPHAADYAGVSVTDMRPPNGVPGPACAPGVLAKLGAGTQLTTLTAGAIAMAMVQGGLTTAPTDPVDPKAEAVHYYCAATNLFDGGPKDTGHPDGTKVPCPAGSAVRFFTLVPPPPVPRPGNLPPLPPSQTSQEEVASLVCQTESCAGATGPCGCGLTLQQWLETDNPGIGTVRADPYWQCTDPTVSSCDDPTDLRRGKTFFKSLPAVTPIFPTLDAGQVTGFRYAEDFQSTSGAQVGFAPTVCLDGGTSTPFCYDPGAVQDLAARLDCVVDIATRFPDALAKYKLAPVQSVVKRALTKAFAYEQEIDANLPTPIIHRGFEELYADLLVMLGDEAFTKALSSRFDLANMSLATFEGSKFEPGGIDLDGTAGFQMYLLYQAAEYHQLALERFYSLAPRLWASVKDLPPGQSFVTPASAVSYFNRLVAASSKKTRVWSEVAKQYKAFNRPDLARLVIQRAYGAAELESSVLTRMMLGLVDVAGSPHAAEIEAAVEQAQAVASSALLDMATAYRDISDDLTYFGFPADYVPFPVLTPFETDVFMKSMALAQEKVDIAKEKEMTALADSRMFDTASQMFQSELASITRDYESQLADLCGTFSVTDANGGAHVYPAIKKYAALSEQTKNLPDPCGLVGNGSLWTAGVTVQGDAAAVEALEKQRDNLLADAQDAAARAAAQCARIQSLADFKLQAADKVLTLQDTINGLNTAIRTLQGVEGMAQTLSGLQKCFVGIGGTDCPTAIVSATAYTLISASINLAITGADIATDGLQHEIQSIDNGVMVQDVLTECTAAEIDMQYTVRQLMRQADELRLEIAKQLLQFKADAGAITKDANQSLLLQQQENDSTQLAINVEAAQNDPNVRVYRNIAVIEADRTFNDAIENAYRATRVFEYFTSQSYAKRGDLFLVRMISSGDHTLEAYLSDLNEAYVEFQEQFGQADTRVVTLSLKDDLLAIPRLGDQGQALSLGDRNDLFHKKLASPDMLDGNGYLTIPFQTTLDSVSPLTSNHKIAYVEAELVGSDLGDTLGRVYVRQKGTGSIRPLSGDKVFYSFPERTAVVDAFFNGTKFFGDDFYQSTRLRDRPFANTSWELVLNQKDETINKDISLGGLSDIRLYLFYTDFTGN